MSIGNIKTAYTSLDLGILRSNGDFLLMVQNDPTTINYNVNGVSMKVRYYYYTWGKVIITIISLTDVISPGTGGPFNITIPYNVNYSQSAVSVVGYTTDSNTNFIFPGSVTNFVNGVNFQIITGVLGKGCIVAIGI
jgi:hypothetical protein